MEKQEVVASIIMETTSEPAPPKHLSVEEMGPHLRFLRFYADLQDFDKFNRNNRLYRAMAMNNGLKQPHITELITKGAFCGEFGHPVGKDVDVPRILTIDPKLISHRITSLDVNSVGVKGWVETLAKGYGEDFMYYILQGMEPAFSLRALAQVTRKGERQFIESTPRIVTYDAVILPSHKVAYRDESVAIKTITKKLQSDGNILHENIVTPILENQIKDFIALESMNLDVISDMYELDKNSMSISKDLNFMYLKEGDNTFSVKIEDKIKHDVTGYMKNLF